MPAIGPKWVVATRASNRIDVCHTNRGRSSGDWELPRLVRGNSWPESTTAALLDLRIFHELRAEELDRSTLRTVGWRAVESV